MTPRMRHGMALLTSDNEPADAAANASFLVVGGGGINLGSGALEFAAIQSSAQPIGSWTTGSATFSTDRDGLQLALVNAEAYSFFGTNNAGPPNYTGTGERATIGAVGATSFSFSSPWSNDGVSLPNNANLGRYGLVLESAHLYAIGGTSNDQDALSTVYSILY
jgi:hypothetical protein